jgi:hypothetical protein
MNPRTWKIAILAFFIGLTIELVVGLSTGNIEAWDWQHYFKAVVPLQAVIWGVMGWTFNRRAWLWPLCAAPGRILAIGILRGDSSIIFMGFTIGLLFMTPELIPYIAISSFTAFVSRRRKRANSTDL